MTDQAPDTLLTALLNVQKELSTLKLGTDEDGQVGSRKYRYVTLHKLHQVVLPILNKYGLVWTTFPGFIRANGEVHPNLTYRLLHVESGREQKGTIPLFMGEQTSQALGSAITYARRYSLLSVIGAVADSDDDGAAASKAPARPRKPPKPEEATEVVPIGRKAGDEPIGPEERDLVEEAMGKIPEREQVLLLTSVGLTSLGDLETIDQGRQIMRRLSA